MKDNDLKRNASGYYDETAYKAITSPPKAGEIWTSADGRKCWLILQNRGDVCSTLLLGKEDKGNSVKIMGKVPMYTDPLMIGYTFTVYIATFVKTIPAANLAEVQKAVGEALGITETAAVPHEPINVLEAKVSALSDRVVSLQNENNELKHDNADLRKENEKLLNDHNMAVEIANDLHAESIELSKEIDKLLIYKELYMDLIDKLVAVRGGAVFDKAGIQ